MGGNPVFRGTRVPVHMLAELVPSRVRAHTPYSGYNGSSSLRCSVPWGQIVRAALFQLT
jgi:hypothetical protein